MREELSTKVVNAGLRLRSMAIGRLEDGRFRVRLDVQEGRKGRIFTASGDTVESAMEAMLHTLEGQYPDERE